MDRTIFKYPLGIADHQLISMPLGAVPLSVQVQAGQLCLWALVPKDSVARRGISIFICGTGHPVPNEAGKFLGTVQFQGGALILHVFEGR